MWRFYPPCKVPSNATSSVSPPWPTHPDTPLPSSHPHGAFTSDSRSDLSLSCPWIRGTYYVNASSRPWTTFARNHVIPPLYLQPEKEQECHICLVPGHTIGRFTATAWAWAKGSFSLISTNVLRPEHIPHKNYQGLCFLTMILISFFWVSKSTVGHLCYLTTLEDRRLWESYQRQVDLFFYVSASTKIKR